MASYKDRTKKIKKDKPFKIVYKYVDTPDADERVFKAFSLLFNEDDIFGVEK